MSLLLLVIIIIINLSLYTIKRVKNANDYISLNQISDNLQSYIQKEFRKENISLLNVQENGNLLEYEIFEKTENKKNEYKLSNKKLRYIKDKYIIILITNNTLYKKNDDGVFSQIEAESEGRNIIVENIKDVQITKENSKIRFKITIFQNQSEKICEFKIDDVGVKKFVWKLHYKYVKMLLFWWF